MQITKFLSLFTLFILLFTACTGEEDENNDESQIRLANKQPLGSSANDLLSAINFTGLTIELVSVQGSEPAQETIKAFRSFLEERVFKPDGIVINQRSIPSSGLAPFTIDEIVELEEINRTSYNEGDQIKVYIYFADGSNEKDTETSFTLGSAYRNTSMVIYENTLRNLAERSGNVDISVLETTTLNHEFCHLFGLVNTGTPKLSDHEDSNNEAHCNVANCLMVSSVEFGKRLKDMVANGVPTLDQKCIADIRANGGK